MFVCIRSFVFCVVFCRSLFVLLCFFFWPLCCLFVSDLRILITPLISSNSFWTHTTFFLFEVSAERLNNAQSCNNLCVMSVNATCFYECSIVLWKGCTRLAVASDKVYQLLDHGRWFSPGTPASSTTKTGRHDIAEILLKVVWKHQKSLKSVVLWKSSNTVW
jgi:hypothetical protein